MKNILKKKIKKTKKNNKKQKIPNERISNKKSTIFVGNIRGLIPGTRRDKLQYISALSEDLETEVIILTETHLEKGISDGEIALPGWNSLRADRNPETKRRGCHIFQ